MLVLVYVLVYKTVINYSDVNYIKISRAFINSNLFISK